MFRYDEDSAEDRVIKILTDNETGECRIGSPEYASIAIKTAHAMDKEMDTILLKLYALEQEIEILESALSEYANRRDDVKEKPDSDWYRTNARESERRMRALVDRIASSKGIVLLGNNWIEDYNNIFGKED